MTPFGSQQIRAGAALVALLVTPSAFAFQLVLDQQPQPSNNYFSAIGTFNVGNAKARLEASGRTPVSGGNPGNNWYGGDPRPVRSWEVLWDNNDQLVTFNVFSSSDWTGTPAMTMAQNAILNPGASVIGINFAARTASLDQSVSIQDVQLNTGSGFTNLTTANALFTGDAFQTRYHRIDGTLTDFALRGTVQFPTGTTTGDSMRFQVSAVQAVPEPASMTALGLAALALLRKRKKAA